jgi:phosphonate transport system substrate-binding protein
MSCPGKNLSLRVPPLMLVLLLLVAAPCCQAQESGLAAAPQLEQTQTPLRIGIHPYLPELYVKQRFMPLVEYLSRLLERPVVLSVSPDYHSHIQRIASGELDIAYMGPASYIKLVDRFGPFPLIARQLVLGEPLFNGVLITREDANIGSVEELRGRTFAFGDPSSTMSHLLPRYVLLQAGIGLDDLGRHAFVGNHQAVALAVLRGDYDAGAVKQEVFASYRRRGLQLLALTPSVSEHLFVASKAMSAAELDELRQLFFGLDDSAPGRKVLRSIKRTLTGMGPVSDADYDNLRAIINSLRESGAQL